MKHVLLVALLTLGFTLTVACGGSSKPPMTPDGPEMGASPEGGTDNPTNPSPVQGTPSTK